MARIDPDRQLVPSVFDRLIDEEPEAGQELPKHRNQILRELKASVRRDLESLLNTRWRCVSWPPDLDQLDLSLVNYGIPDFTGMQFASASARDELRLIIEKVVRKFEPRFKTVKVEIIERSQSLDRTFHFRIDATLYAEPAPEPVVFDTVLEATTGDFEVKGSEG
jgi:type VI secretion system protein ImpF